MSKHSKIKVSALSSIPWQKYKPENTVCTPPWIKKPNKVQRGPEEQLNIRETGERGEQMACEYLQTQGLTLIDRNVRFRGGEIDLIMSEGMTAVIIEVRVRNNAAYGDALETIDHHKQRRLNRSAKLWWVKTGQRSHKFLRFDVVAIDGHRKLSWIQNAWQLPE